MANNNDLEKRLWEAADQQRANSSLTLIFALKYEGTNLLFFKKLFEKIEEKEIIDLLKQESLSQYSRRIWFLYEWLMEKEVDLPDLKS